MRNLDAFQHRFYAFIHLAQGFANVATITLATFSTNRDTRRDKQWAVDGLYYFEGRNRVRGPRQPVTTMRAMMREQQTSPNQSLENLRQCLRRDAERIGNVFRAGAARAGLAWSAKCFMAISA